MFVDLVSDKKRLSFFDASKESPVEYKDARFLFRNGSICTYDNQTVRTYVSPLVQVNDAQGVVYLVDAMGHVLYNAAHGYLLPVHAKLHILNKSCQP